MTDKNAVGAANHDRIPRSAANVFDDFERKMAAALRISSGFISSIRAWCSQLSR
jgi:hypothetical protein